MMPTPTSAPIGCFFTAPACQICHITTTRRRCPICQRKTVKTTLEKTAPDRAEDDTGLTFAIWPFERLDTLRATGPRRPASSRHIAGRARALTPKVEGIRAAHKEQKKWTESAAARPPIEGAEQPPGYAQRVQRFRGRLA